MISSKYSEVMKNLMNGKKSKLKNSKIKSSSDSSKLLNYQSKFLFLSDLKLTKEIILFLLFYPLLVWPFQTFHSHN